MVGPAPGRLVAKKSYRQWITEKFWWIYGAASTRKCRPLAKRLKRMGDVRRPKGKKQSAQYSLFQEKPSSQQSSGATGIWRKASERCRLIRMAPWQASATMATASSKAA